MAAVLNEARPQPPPAMVNGSSPQLGTDDRRVAVQRLLASKTTSSRGRAKTMSADGPSTSNDPSAARPMRLGSVPTMTPPMYAAAHDPPAATRTVRTASVPARTASVPMTQPPMDALPVPENGDLAGKRTQMSSASTPSRMGRAATLSSRFLRRASGTRGSPSPAPELTTVAAGGATAVPSVAPAATGATVAAVPVSSLVPTPKVVPLPPPAPLPAQRRATSQPPTQPTNPARERRQTTTARSNSQQPAPRPLVAPNAASTMINKILAQVKAQARDPKVMTEPEFLELVTNSCQANEPMDLSGQVVELTRAVRLKRNQQLVIFGGTIAGDAHSLFQIDTDKSHVQLILRGTRLIHMAESPNPRDVGGAIFSMGGAIVQLDDCTLHSTAGFGVWAKHRSKVVMHNCTLEHIGRTGVACFNDTVVEIVDSRVANCGVHGVCVRGKGKVNMLRSEVVDCATRGIYAYQKATLSMEECTVTGTKDPAAPAVHAQAQLDNTSVTLKMAKCQIVDNAGPSVLIEGRVVVKMRKNVTSTDAQFSAHVPPPAPPPVRDGSATAGDATVDSDSDAETPPGGQAQAAQVSSCASPSALSYWFPGLDFLCACRQAD